MKYIKKLNLAEDVSYDYSITEAKVNPSGYIKAGKLGYNDQFLGRRSLSYTLASELGLDPKNEFKGPWLGFDHMSLYATGPNGGTILDDALSGKYTYAELKSAAAKHLSIKESMVTEAKNTIGLAFKEEQDYLDFKEFVAEQPRGAIRKNIGFDSKTKSWNVEMDVKVLDSIYGEGTSGNKKSGWYGGLPDDFESVIIESVVTEAKVRVTKKDIKDIEDSGNIDIAYKKAMALLKSLSESVVNEAKSNIKKKWASTNTMMDDLKEFINDAKDAGGEDLVRDIHDALRLMTNYAEGELKESAVTETELNEGFSTWEIEFGKGKVSGVDYAKAGKISVKARNTVEAIKKAVKEVGKADDWMAVDIKSLTKI